VAEKAYAYFSGCSLEGTASSYNESVKAVLKVLGVSYEEPADWSCCGSTPAHSVDHVFAAALAARNLAIVEKMGAETLTTPCPSCFSVFKKAHVRMAKSKAFREEVNSLLDEPYEGSLKVKSTLQIIYEDVGIEAVAAKVTKALPDLRIAPYYGCIISRPPKIAEFDDPENPISMDKLMEAIGVKVVDYAFKTECCGAAFGVPKKEMVLKLTHKVLSMAEDAGANCVVVACPLCQQNLDLRQGQINALMGSSFHLPIVYFTQLMGLAYGLSPAELGLNKHIVSADALIKNRVPIEEYLKQEAEAKKEAKPKKKEAAAEPQEEG
jgi:heterodisulfide reductase subunit B